MRVVIPGRGKLDLRHLVLDVNGTLAADGVLLPNVGGRLGRLRHVLDVHLLTADTHGAQDRIDALLDLRATRLDPDSPGAEQKAAYVRALGPSMVVAVGNGANDRLMFREAALAIAVLGHEGLAASALCEADVVAPSIQDALDLLLFPARLVATLRE